VSAGETREKDDGLLGFRDVLEAEFKTIFPNKELPAGLDRYELRRQFYDIQASALCLSGGGIRSASFCLGVLQGLAKRGALLHFNYLSTVSGGGYTGSMLSAWAYRAKGGIHEVQEKLKTGPDRDSPVTRLRGYTNYLAPRKGVRSPDFWTLIATYARNLILNWLILVPLFGLFLTAPYLLIAAMGFISENQRQSLPPLSNVAFYAGAILVVLGVFLLRQRTSLLGQRDDIAHVAENTRAADTDAGTPAAPQPRRDQSEFQREERQAPQFGGHTLALWLCYGLGVLLLTASWYWRVESRSTEQWFGAIRWWTRQLLEWSHVVPVAWERFLALPLFAAGLGTVLGIFFCVLWYVRRWRGKHVAGPSKTRLNWFLLVLAFATTGGITGTFLVGWSSLWQNLSEPDVLRRFIVFGPPLLLLLVVLAEILFQGLASKLSDDYDREWWSQVCARLLMVAGIWIAWFGITFYGPIALQSGVALNEAASRWPRGLFHTAIVVFVIFGAILARIGFTRGPIQTQTDKPPLLANLGDYLFRAACWVFIVLFFALLAWLVSWALGAMHEWRTNTPPGDGLVRVHVWNTLLLMAFFVVVLVIACWSVNINKFSLHGMYRERLIRAFLGISRADHGTPEKPLDEEYNEPAQFDKRRPNDYTDFDRDDNPILYWLDPQRALWGGQLVRPPFHVINCALNLVGGHNLAWQERKASSFTVSALHTGGAETYRNSKEFCSDAGGITLGTALTMSGAALAPNAGFYSSTLNTFIMTLFNARLGWWLGHPSKPNLASKVSPRFALWPMLRELAGKTHGESNWIYLSDGGHFDNLGLYEMVRRGCRYIVVIDASADSGRKLDDFGNALRKIRIDFGIHIERRRDAPWRIGTADQGTRGRYCALFEIDYTPWLGNIATSAEKDPEEESSGRVLGRLLYIKPSYYAHENSDIPIDVVQYAGTSGNFPHQSTIEQFYDESQFESYRALGEHQITSIYGDFQEPGSVKDLIDQAGKHIRGDEVSGIQGLAAHAQAGMTQVEMETKR
jgi:hypothetical protein